MKTEVKLAMGVAAALLIAIVAAIFYPTAKSTVASKDDSNPLADVGKGGPTKSAQQNTLESDVQMAVPAAHQPTTMITPPSIEIGGSSTSGGPTTLPSGMFMSPSSQPSGGPTTNMSPTNMGSMGMSSGAPSPGSTDWNTLLAGASTPVPSGGSTSMAPPMTAGPRSTLTPGSGFSLPAPGSRTGTGVTPPTGSSSAGTTYTIKKGDTLASIATTVYGSANYWPKIVQANQGINPNRLKTGQVIKLPSESEVKPSAGSAAKEEKTSGSSLVKDPSRQYQVQAGDTLEKIAVHLYGNGSRWQEIYDLNKSTIGSSPRNLKIGMVLKLPSAPKAGSPGSSSMTPTAQG